MYTLLNIEQQNQFNLKRIQENPREGDYLVFLHHDQIIRESDPDKYSANTLYDLYRIIKVTKSSIHIHNDIAYRGSYYSRYKINPKEKSVVTRQYPPSNNTFQSSCFSFLSKEAIQEIFPMGPFLNQYKIRIRQKIRCLGYDIETNSSETGCHRYTEIYTIFEEYDTKGWCDACWSKRQNK